MQQQEIWKDIPEYEGLYQVSNLGNVKSLSRKVFLNNKYRYLSKEKLLKPVIIKSGYLIICLHKNLKQKSFYIHKLVAISFLNHIPCGFKLVVDHINNNKLDNNVVNLQIITTRENTSKNKKLSISSKYVVVSWCKSQNKWYSCIRINSKTKNLGYFKNEIDAHLAYQNKLKELKQLN